MDRLRRSGLTFLFEALGVLVLLVLFNVFVLPERPGFLDASPHPYVVASLLGAARYGFFPGVVIALIFTVGYYTQLALGVEVASWQDFLASRFSQPAIFTVTGSALLGLVADQHIRRVARAEARLGELEAATEAMQRSQADLRDVNAELASRIVGAESTLPVLYRYARLLNATDEDAIYRGLVEVAADALGAEQVSLYMPRGPNLVRRYGEGPESFPLDLRVTARILREGGVFTLKELPAPGPEGPALYLAGALRQGEGGPVMGVLTVDRLDFLRYTEANLGLFRMLVEWAAVSLGQAVAFSRLSDAERAARTQAAEKQGKRSAGVFAKTGFIRVADVERTIPDDMRDDDEEVVSSAGFSQVARPGFKPQLEPAATQMLSEGDLASLDASGGDLSVAIAAEVGRAGVEGARFATLLTRLGDHLGAVKGRR